MLLPFGGRSPAVPGTDPLLGRLDASLGRLLAALPAQVVWATTWESEANTTIAPLLGLAELPVVAWSDATGHEAADDWLGLHWKTRTLTDWAAGRAFVWVDDEVTRADRDWVGDNHPEPTLLYRIDARVGLRASDVAAIGDWLRRRAVTEAG